MAVLNAIDGQDADRRRTETANQINKLASIGLSAQDFDLRDFAPDTIESALGEPDFLWVRGGNVFILRTALSRSGLDQLLVDQLASDRFVYAGFSAGPCVLAPSLRGLEWCDSVDDCRTVYGDVHFDGLGVIDRPVVPHLNSPDHPETDVLSEVAARYTAAGQSYWALEDGQALVVDGAETSVLD